MRLIYLCFYKFELGLGVSDRTSSEVHNLSATGRKACVENSLSDWFRRRDIEYTFTQLRLTKLLIELATMATRSYSLRTIPRFHPGHMSGPNPCGEYLDTIAILRCHLHQSRSSHRMVPAWCWSCSCSLCTFGQNIW
jgi:hypothetical protein